MSKNIAWVIRLFSVWAAVLVLTGCHRQSITRSLNFDQVVKPRAEDRYRGAEELTIHPELRFSADGRRLKLFEKEAVVVYDVEANVKLERILLPGAEIAATSVDGGKALLLQDTRLLLLDTESGLREEVLGSWTNAYAFTLSGDARLLGVVGEAEVDDQTERAIDVYDLVTRKRVAHETFGNGGNLEVGITPDGRYIEYKELRWESSFRELKSGREGPSFRGPRDGATIVRSFDGEWAIELPNRSWQDEAPLDVVIKDGKSGRKKGKLAISLEDEDLQDNMTVAFCGNRVVLGRPHEITVYDLPSGSVVARYPEFLFIDDTAGAEANPDDFPVVACSPKGDKIGVAIGSRLRVLPVPSAEASTKAFVARAECGTIERTARELSRLARTEGRVVRDGCVLKFGSGPSFTDNPQEGVSYAVHEYLGKLPDTDFDLVATQLSESFEYHLVSPTGAEARLVGEPVLSPDGRRIVASSIDLEAGEAPNAIEVWDIRKGVPRLEFSLRAREWGPSRTVWTDASTIEFEQNFLEVGGSVRTVFSQLRRGLQGWSVGGLR